uniref:GlcG/HbpS family heme-binding protein n=1 Tax=Pararhizobium sp. IMCC3301 TaxID=3067904 RepID=UPI00274074B5|nr:heme-binding protein [Pararhizobium sp. IMCC3301]
MTKINMQQARTMIDAAIAKASELGLKPLGISVLDAGGHLRAYLAQDGTSMLRPQISAGKAYGALAVGAGSRWLNAQAAERPHFLEGLNGVAGGRIIPVPGGVLVRDQDGDIIGAVGISGDTSDNDEICAVAGIEAAEFTADPG